MCMFPQESQLRKIELSGIYNDEEFSYRFFGENKKMFYDPVQERKSRQSRTANMLSGETKYFEKGKCDFELCVRASATVPYVSKPVIINGAECVAKSAPRFWEDLSALCRGESPNEIVQR